MSLPAHLINNASHLPFFCSSSSLVFYLGKIIINYLFIKHSFLIFFLDDSTTFSQVLTLYNPYEFAVRYKGCFFVIKNVILLCLSSAMHSSTNIFYCRTRRRNSSTTFSGYVRKTKRSQKIIFYLLELYVFLIHRHQQQIRMLYIKFVYNILIVENRKIL